MEDNVTIELSGDCWNNPAQVQEKLKSSVSTFPILLDIRSEGPSLVELGVVDTVNQWLDETGRSPESVVVTRWSNPVEFVPYRKHLCSTPSHFFSMCRDYWIDRDPEFKYDRLFGLFIGRLTIARATILYQVLTELANSFFTSKMKHTELFPWLVDYSQRSNLENINHWLPLHQQAKMFSWYEATELCSVDQLCVRDQFLSATGYVDTNKSLLSFYNNFAIELVCETYTLGSTFFPTEKTIRPLMAAKPLLVYGPKYYLARLRSLGFKTFHSLWDESYDLLEGPARWKKIKQVIAKIKDMNLQQRHDLLEQANVISLYNRQRLYDVANWRVDLTKHDYTKI